MITDSPPCLPHGFTDPRTPISAQAKLQHERAASAADLEFLSLVFLAKLLPKKTRAEEEERED